MSARAVIGAAGGFVWFIVLAMAETGRLDSFQVAGVAPWAWLLLSGAVTLAAAWMLLWWGRAFGIGLCVGLAAGLALGLVEGPALGAPGLLSLPAIFSAGLGSISVWVALGVSVAGALLRPAIPMKTMHERDVAAR